MTVNFIAAGVPVFDINDKNGNTDMLVSDGEATLGHARRPLDGDDEVARRGDRRQRHYRNIRASISI